MTAARRRLVAIVFLLIAGGIVAFWIGRSWRSAPDGAAVLREVRKLNQLATVRYTIQKVIDLEQQTLPVGSERILLVLQASVQAGIDLSALGPNEVERRRDGSVVIHLPPAAILDVSVDEKATKVWDRQKTWWTPWVPYSLDLETKARVKGLEEAKAAALSLGILRQAEQNAETAIRGLLDLSGVKNVIILRGSVS